MKKIFTVLMALGIALCTMANSAVSVEASKFRLANNGAKATAVEKKQIHNEVSIAKDQVLKQSFTKKLSKDRKAVTQQVRRMASAARAAQSTTDADTVHIQAAYFSIEQYPGEWYIGVMNQEETYQVYFDYFSETMTGSFTTEDFYMTYSKVYDFTGDGVAVNFNAVELTVTETAVSSTLTRVNLDAVIDGSDGKVYVVTGFYETITPKKTVELVVTENTVLQDGEGSFAIEGQTTYEGELVTVAALIASEDVLGEFSASDFYFVGSFVGFGPVDEMNIINLLDASAVVTMEAGQYVFELNYLGVDTVLYHTMLYHALPAPTDTIDIEIGNLVVDDALAAWFGQFWCDGSNSEYLISVTLFGYEALDGVYDSQNTSISLYEIATDSYINIVNATAELSTKADGTRQLVATALSGDNVLYNIDMQFVVPEAKDTVVIDFGTQVGEATFFESWGDYQIYTVNENYGVALDIITLDLNGEFATEDFDLNYTFVSPINGTDTTFVSILDANAVITPVNDSLIDVHAELVGVDSTLYQVHTLATIIIPEVRLDYDEQTGSVDRTYTSEDDVMFDNYIAASGYVTLDVTAADASDILGLLFFVESEDPTTVIPVGTYPINATQEYGTVLKSSGVSSNGSLTYSVYGTLAANGNVDKCYFLVDGEVIVSEVNGNLKVEVNATNSYGVPVHIVYDATPVTPAEPVEMVGVVKRAVQNGDAVIVLTHEEDGTAHIYNVVEGLAYEVSQEGVIPVDAENPGDYLAISDIAVTEDGKLVANNYIRCSFNDGVVESGYKRGTLTFYIWEDLAAAPAIWFQSKASSNSNNSDQGYTMAVTGTSTNANILVSGVHNTQRGVRMSHFSIVDGVFEDTQDGSANLPYYYYVGSNFKGASAGADAAVFNEQTHGANIQFHASPLTPENWIIDGELTNPIEFINPQTHGGEVVINATLTEDLGKKYNGATYVTVDDQVLMAAPFANPDGELVGVEILNITNGFDAPQYVNMVYVDEAVAVEAAATAVQVLEGGLNITLVADNTIQTWFVELNAGSDWEVYEEEITNLVIDLDNLVLIGGPSANLQVDVYLPLGEYNMSEDSYQLTSESSISVLGQDATFIEGYAYEIDAFTPSAKAVVRCEWNGMKLEFHLTMSAAPMEATVVVVEDAVVKVEKYQIWGDMYDYALTMTGAWVNPADGLTYPVLVEVPVYYPEATEPSEIMSTVTVGGWNDDDPWLGFGEGTLTVTTVDGVVTATGIVQNPMAGIAIDITISGKLPQDPGPGTGIEDVEVEVKAVKLIKNGQLIINRDGKMYNAQGAILK